MCPNDLRHYETLDQDVTTSIGWNIFSLGFRLARRCPPLCGNMGISTP